MHSFISKIFKNSKYEIDIITSSPKANGFYKGGFFKKHIPNIYRRYEQILLNQNSKINMHEYEKNNWTFHTKGLWFYEKDKNLPSMTIIGSSNYSIHFLLIINRL